MTGCRSRLQPTAMQNKQFSEPGQTIGKQHTLEWIQLDNPVESKTTLHATVTTYFLGIAGVLTFECIHQNPQREKINENGCVEKCLFTRVHETKPMCFLRSHLCERVCFCMKCSLLTLSFLFSVTQYVLIEKEESWSLFFSRQTPPVWLKLTDCCLHSQNFSLSPGRSALLLIPLPPYLSRS